MRYTRSRVLMVLCEGFSIKFQTGSQVESWPSLGIRHDTRSREEAGGERSSRMNSMIANLFFAAEKATFCSCDFTSLMPLDK